VIAGDGGDDVLRLATGADVDFTHNRFWLPADGCAVAFDYRVVQASGAGDELRVIMRDVEAAVDEVVETITFDAAAGWVVDHVAALPAGVLRPLAYRLTFELPAGSAAGAVVHVDNVRINAPPGDCGCPWDLDLDGAVGVTDFLELLAAWGDNPGHPADFTGDGTVGVEDFLMLLANWGACS